MKKLLLPFSFLLLPFPFPANAWDYNRFDPGNPSASGFVKVFEDNFSSLSSIDQTNSILNNPSESSFKWYQCMNHADTSEPYCAPGGDMSRFSILTEGGETFLRMIDQRDNNVALVSGHFENRDGQHPFVGHSFGQVNGKPVGWFFEYETRFNPAQVMVPYNPTNQPCYTVPSKESGYTYVAPAVTSATWSSANGGQITVNFTSAYPLSPGQGVQLYHDGGTAADAYDGWYVVSQATSGQVILPKASDPGAANLTNLKISGWGLKGSSVYKGYMEANGCTCAPGSSTPGCRVGPGAWAQATSWADLTFQKPGAQTGYTQYAEDDILEYFFHNWYGSTRMMLLNVIDWYGLWLGDAPSAPLTNGSYNAGTGKVTLTGTEAGNVKIPQVGETVNISEARWSTSFTGSISGNVLTVTAVTGGQKITVTGDYHSLLTNNTGCVYIPGTIVYPIAQTSGTPGGVGEYQLVTSPPGATIPGCTSTTFTQPLRVPMDGNHVVTDNPSANQFSFAVGTDPGTWGGSSEISSYSPALTANCQKGGYSTGYCRRYGNHPNRISYAPASTNWNNWTKVSQLWVPGDATNGKHGFVETYINGYPVLRTDWVTDVTHAGNPKIPHVMSVMDRNAFFLFLELGAGYPVDVNYVRVWQQPQ